MRLNARHGLATILAMRVAGASALSVDGKDLVLDGDAVRLGDEAGICIAAAAQSLT